MARHSVARHVARRMRELKYTMTSLGGKGLLGKHAGVTAQ
jgi:hypothetical protein